MAQEFCVGGSLKYFRNGSGMVRNGQELCMGEFVEHDFMLNLAHTLFN